MSVLVPAAVAAVPLVAGWSAHSVWLARRLSAARRDPLTGLPTRAEFEKAARRILRRQNAAVVVIDLDDFKELNDTLGHAAGDAALIATAAALYDLTDDEFGPGGITARLGGDEFAAIVPQTTSHGLPWLLSGLHGCVRAPFDYHGRTLTVGASVGGVFAPAGTPLSVALRRADEAMYAAKQRGGGSLAVFDLTPEFPTVNGRRAGRTGAHHDAPEGGAS